MVNENVHSQNVNSFYRSLTPFRDFNRITDWRSYSSVPDDWTVMITDIENSTEAIEQGQYKAVNMMGAASITAVLNCGSAVDIPYVFGGDGATIVVPPDYYRCAKDQLLGVSEISKRKFGLNLRVGGVSVAELRSEGRDLKVSKFELSPGNYLAMFSGGGLVLADHIIKSGNKGNPHIFESRSQSDSADLEGLSCRWEPLTPRNGLMLTMMVQTLIEDPDHHRQILSEILRELSEILQGDPQLSAPASEYSMNFRWPPRGLWMEARSLTNSGNGYKKYASILLESFIQFICEKFDRKAGPYDAPLYRQELRSNTDFQKYDDVLRMVLDVSPEQAERINRILDCRRKKKQIVYGTYLSPQALMTCLVFSLENSEHVHFIDGSDGGFAMAAKMFKKQLADHAM